MSAHPAEEVGEGKEPQQPQQPQEEEGDALPDEDKKGMHSEILKSLQMDRSDSLDTEHLAGGLTEGMLQSGFGVDIGGSVCKILFFDPSEANRAIDAKHRVKVRDFLNSSDFYGSSGTRDADLDFTLPSGRFYFMKFLTSRMDGAIELMRGNSLTHEDQIVGATGGGAYKFGNDFRDKLGIEFVKTDEFGAVVLGVSYLLTTIPKEIYCYVNPRENDLTRFVEHFSPQGESIFPYLLCNCGSGISLLVVRSPTDFERVCGSHIGGATFVGLCAALTGERKLERIVELANSGDNTRVDTLVQDIYGEEQSAAWGLSSSLLASSFGKLQQPQVLEHAEKADLANAVMKMLTYNIGSLIVLNATIHKTDRVVITGGFTAFALLKQRLANAVDFWSAGKINAKFVKHAAYSGCVGAFLHTLKLHERRVPTPKPASSSSSSSSSSSFASQQQQTTTTST